MASRTLGLGAREGRQAIPQPQQGGALQTALEIRNREVKQLTEENGKLRGELGHVRGELQEKEEVVEGMRRDMDGLIQQLAGAGNSGEGEGQGAQADDLELQREVEEGRQEISRLKEELDKANKKGATAGKISQAMEELVLKKRKDDALQTELGATKEELEKVKEEVGSLKENEKKLEGDLQGVRDELAGSKEELQKVRKQLGEEEELRKASELKLKSIGESVKIIVEARDGCFGNVDGGGSGSPQTQSPSGGRDASVKDRSDPRKRKLSSASMTPPKKQQQEVQGGFHNRKSADASSENGDEFTEGNPGQLSLNQDHPAQSIQNDIRSDPEDGVEEGQQVPAVAAFASPPPEHILDFDMSASEWPTLAESMGRVAEEVELLPEDEFTAAASWAEAAASAVPAPPTPSSPPPSEPSEPLEPFIIDPVEWPSLAESMSRAVAEMMVQLPSMDGVVDKLNAGACTPKVEAEAITPTPASQVSTGSGSDRSAVNRIPNQALKSNRMHLVRKRTIQKKNASKTTLHSTSRSSEVPNRDLSPDLAEYVTEVVVILSSSQEPPRQHGSAEAVGSTPSTPVTQPDDDPSDTGFVEESEQMETTGADPAEIDTKVIPDETVLQRSTLNLKGVALQKTSGNGKKRNVTGKRTARRVPIALTRLLRHAEDKAKRLYCLCGNRFANRRSVRRHVAYFKAEPSLCDICNKSFRSRNKLKVHKIKAHSDPVRRTPNPSPKFPSGPKKIVEVPIVKENGHGFSHAAPGNVPEVPPGPGTSSLSGSGATQYFCKCGQQFPSNEAFLQHMNTIKLEGTFKCCWCPCGFQRALALKLHQKEFHAVEFAQSELKQKRKKK